MRDRPDTRQAPLFPPAPQVPANSSVPPHVPDDIDFDEVPFILSDEERGIEGPDETRRRAELLAEELKSRLKIPVRLTVTDNASSVFSFRQKSAGDEMTVRVHHMFLDAPPAVLDDLASFAQDTGEARRQASRRLDAFISSHMDQVRESNAAFRPIRLVSRGRTRDLKDILDSLNARFFGGRVEARIGWGRLPKRRNRQSIRLGVYDSRTKVIRIHPALDTPEVPDFFVEFIVFHEMLHQAIPAREGSGRQSIHGKDFRREEAAFPDYERAVRWEKAHLAELIRSMPLRPPRG